jgi:AcrR family transcriptional regulator
MTRRDAGRPRGVLVEHLVLECVLDVLASAGHEAMSVDRIAEAAQVNKTTIYRRWPTREALIAATLEYVWKGLSLEIRDTGSLQGDVVALCESLSRFLESREGQALGRAAMAASNPLLSSRARQALAESASNPAAHMVMRAVERGEWRAEAAPEVALGMLVGGFLHRLFLEGQGFDPAWRSHIVDLFCRAVRP